MGGNPLPAKNVRPQTAAKSSLVYNTPSYAIFQFYNKHFVLDSRAKE